MGPARVLRCTLLLGLIFLVVAGPSLAQARAATSSESVTPSHAGSDNVIRFWYALPDRCSSRFADMLSIFEKAHPQLHVEGRCFPSMDALHAALLNGSELPHLALIDSTWQDELIRQNRLQPAEDLMNKVGVMVRIILKADTFPSMWDAVVRDGKVWTVPAFGTTHALVFDQDMLAEAGFKAPPKKWADLVTMGKELSRPEAGTWGFSLPTDASPQEIGRLLQVFGWQAGGSQSGLDGVDSPEATQALQYWMDLIQKYHIAPAEPVVDKSKVAMFLGTVEELLDGQGRGRHLDAAPLPALKLQAADLTVYTVAMFANDPHLADRNWEMVAWLTEFPQMLDWSLNTAFLPANKQVTLSPGYFQYLQAHPGLRSFLAQLRTSHVDPLNAQAMQVVGLAVKSALEAKTTAHDALAAARQQAEAVVKQ